VITGEAIRTRSERASVEAISCESASPWPGVNQARTRAPLTSAKTGSTRPLFSTSPPRQSSSKLAP